MTNLIINGVDAMPEGGRVTISGRQEGSVLILSVSDTGQGIPETHLDQIFDTFFTTKPTGTGLGLALARKVVEDHGAKLQVSSQEGRGTVFSIVFQLDESPPPPVAPLNDREAAETRKGSP